jgi:hypothetical protein
MDMVTLVVWRRPADGQSAVALQAREFHSRSEHEAFDVAAIIGRFAPG